MYIKTNKFISFSKALTWRILGTIDTMVIALAITQNYKVAFSIGGIELFTKIALYYFHERIWEYARRINLNEFKNTLRKKKGSEINEMVSWVITQKKKEELLNQKGMVLWMTGLSGSGKSTIANLVEKKLYEQNKISKILDGDVLRNSINCDLGFTESERLENIRRTAEIAKILKDSGIITIVSVITPFNIHRELAKNIIGDDFALVYINSSIQTCIERDTKGLYLKALKGDIKEFTGISSIFEAPGESNIEIKTDVLTIEESVDAIMNFINKSQ